MKSTGRVQTKNVSTKQVAQIISRAAEREGKVVRITQGQRKALRATKQA